MIIALWYGISKSLTNILQLKWEDKKNFIINNMARILHVTVCFDRTSSLHCIYTKSNAHI